MTIKDLKINREIKKIDVKKPLYWFHLTWFEKEILVFSDSETEREE